MSRPARRRPYAVLLLAAGLAACTSLRETPQPVAAVPAPAPPVVAPPPVNAPAPPPTRRAAAAGCVPRSLPAAPAYPDTDARLKSAGEAAERYQLMAAGRLLRMRRLAELERVVAACRRAGS